MLSPKTIQRIHDELKEDDGHMAVLFQALSDMTRFNMFKILLTRSDVCVTDIARILDISVPAASQQLKILEASGVVTPERRGQMICYLVRKQDPHVRALIRIMEQSSVLER